MLATVSFDRHGDERGRNRSALGICAANRPHEILPCRSSTRAIFEMERAVFRPLMAGWQDLGLGPW